MRLKTRFVNIAGITPTPNEAFVQQVVRNLTDMSDGFLLDSKFLIMDRDPKYTVAFRANLKREGVEPVRCPVRAPNFNAFAKRFVRSIKNESLDRMILLSNDSFRRGPALSGAQGVREALPYRTQSSGRRESIAGATCHGRCK